MRFLSRCWQLACVCFSLVLVLFASFLCSAAVAFDSDCTRTCGTTGIPFPFGITPGCGLPGFQLNCSATSKDSPSKQFDGTGEAGLLFPFVGTGSGPFQVLNITPVSIIINVTDLKAVSCDGEQVIATFVLDPHSPFVLSGNNKFFVTGCNFTGDITTDTSFGTTGHCNVSHCNGTQPLAGTAICNSQQSCVDLPAGPRQVVMRGSGYGHGRTGCEFASIGYPPSFVSRGDDATGADMQYGLELAYFVQGRCKGQPNTPDSVCSENATCSDVEHVAGYVCRCDRAGYVGDGYLGSYGCSDVDECSTPGVEDGCAADADCINRPGGYECHCLMGYEGDGYSDGTGCVIVDKNHMTGVLAIAATLVVVILVIVLGSYACWFCKRRKSRETVESRKSVEATSNP